MASLTSIAARLFCLTLSVAVFQQGSILASPLDGPFDRGAVWVLFLSNCGDGILDPDEECDDGNVVSGDGCTADCVYEDTDADGVPDLFDNCEDIANPDQSNRDAGVFGEQRIISTLSDYLAYAIAADLDGDADQDVVSASTSDETIAWYENVGGSDAFGQQRVISVGGVEYVRDLAIADIDGDGDEDVIGGSHTEIAWFENLDGAGFFGGARMIETDRGLVGLDVADLDGDGDLDVVSSSYYDYNGLGVGWYENLDGSGNFGPRQLIDEEAGRDVLVTDVDGDGDIDIISSSPAAWRENLDGLGNFGPPRIIIAEDARSAAVADVDGDGDPDVLIVVTDPGHSRLVWNENLDGQGEFGPEQVVTESISTHTPVVGADLDGDGDIDLAVDGPHGVSWIENLDGAGTFDEATPISWAVRGVRSIGAVDLDGDADVDLLSASDGDEKVAWYPNEGDERGDACDTCPDEGDPAQADTDEDGRGNACDNCTEAANPDQVDFDEDGLGDACDGCPKDPYNDTDDDGLCEAYDNCAIEPNRDQSDVDGDNLGDVCDNCVDIPNPFQTDVESGTYEPARVLTGELVDLKSRFAADVDGDGDSDVLVTHESAVGWIENLGELYGFAPPRYFDTIGSAESVFAADIDGDADQDAIVTTSFPHRVDWYENLDGEGDFSTARPILAERPHRLLAVDLDGDDDTDVLADDGVTLWWQENLDGDGDFGPKRPICRAGDYSRLSVGDIDGDGDQDVLADATTYFELLWYENLDGVGTFSAGRLIGRGNPGIATLADADSDGDLDVLAHRIHSLVWYENLIGTGISWKRHSTSCGDRLDSFFVGDMDSDGDVDAVVVHGFDEIAWCENLDGHGDFGSPSKIVTRSAAERELTVVDLDGDGDPDILWEMLDLDLLAWSENNSDDVGDVCDNCPADDNDDQIDADGDGLGDGCDNCPESPDPDQSDFDDDDVGDQCDNCIDTANTDQANADGDVFGDVCDRCPEDSTAGQTDNDVDGLGDACDECPTIFNPGQEQEFACISVGEGGGGPCLETRIDLVDGAASGEIVLYTFEPALPESMTFEFLTSVCHPGGTLTFSLNGVDLGVVLLEPGPGTCGCIPPTMSLTIDDAELLRSIWNPGGSNTFGIAMTEGPYFAWAGVRIVAGSQTMTECLYDYGGGGCDEMNVCLGGFTTTPFMVSPAISDTLGTVPTVANRIPFSNGQLPLTIDLAGIPAGPVQICVVDSDENGECVTFARRDESEMAINGGGSCPPVAEAASTYIGGCAALTGAEVRLEGHESVDFNSTYGTNDDIVLFEWFEDFGTPGETFLGSGERLELSLPIGTHVFTLRVTDSTGNMDSDVTGLRMPLPCWDPLDAAD